METTAPAPQRLDQIVDRLKAMADPTRLRILYALRDEEELCVGDVTDRLDCSQANASKQLAVLKRAGLVRRRREGMNVFYALDCDAVFDVCALMCRRDGS
jgi:ArsR family transcriptional regulator